jgi:hypothetical protein
MESAVTEVDRGDAPTWITAGRFDVEYIRPQVGHEHRRVGSRQVAGGVKYSKSRQRAIVQARQIPHPLFRNRITKEHAAIGHNDLSVDPVTTTPGNVSPLN